MDTSRFYVLTFEKHLIRNCTESCKDLAIYCKSFKELLKSMNLRKILKSFYIHTPEKESDCHVEMAALNGFSGTLVRSELGQRC